VKALVVLIAALVLAAGAATAGYLIAERGDGDDAQATSLCVNARKGYRVEFPAGWHVGGTADDATRAELVCSFFDPEPFSIPAGSDFFGTALEVHALEQPFEAELSSLTDPRFARTLTRTTLTLGARSALTMPFASRPRRPGRDCSTAAREPTAISSAAFTARPCSCRPPRRPGSRSAGGRWSTAPRDRSGSSPCGPSRW
jgi:hypothetical protein